MGLLKVEVSQNIDSLITAVEQFGANLSNVASFCEDQVINAVRYQIFDAFVLSMANEAGMPHVYTEHIIAFMRTIPIRILFGQNGFSLAITLSSMGDMNDLSLGFHDQALIGTPYPPWTDIHPPQVQLPSGGSTESSLMTGEARRAEFWDTVIINRDVESFISTIKSAGLQAVLRNKILANVPTYEEIAARRVAVWVAAGVAPEWLLMEEGSPRSGTQPVITPVFFMERLREACQCVMSKVVQQAIRTITAIFKRERAAGAGLVRIGRGGRPYKVIPGKGARFIKFADIRDENPADITQCLFL